jgi:hypothetical protein
MRALEVTDHPQTIHLVGRGLSAWACSLVVDRSRAPLPYRALPAPGAAPLQLTLRHQPLLNERGPDPAAQAVWSKLHLNLSLDLHWQHLVKQG